jgi:fluoroacetyl-CoA thioesterase
MADFRELAVGLTASVTQEVGAGELAPAVGSGRVAVFASPMLVALFERAAVSAVEDRLGDGFHSLGTHLDVTHTAPTPAGLTVTATATLEAIDGRKLTFRCSASDGIEAIGAGNHTRIIVDRARFDAKVDRKRP